MLVHETQSGFDAQLLQRKVCLIGATSVGKTSLVRRFVESTFSDSYLATIGVKVDRKRVEIGGRVVSLMLWDLRGEEAGQEVRMAYLRGCAGYLLVVDGTRAETLSVAERLQDRAKLNMRANPFVVLINKSDRFDEWELSDSQIARVRDAHGTVFFTSAKTGAGVEEAFRAIAERTIAS